MLLFIFILISAFLYICVCLLERRVIPISDQIWSHTGNKIDEKRCLGEPKWRQNPWKMVSRRVWAAMWSGVGCGESRWRCITLHKVDFGSILGAKWKPNGLKLEIKIASKFRVDFEEHLEAKIVRKGRPKGTIMESKWRENRFQEASEAKLVILEKKHFFRKEN